MKKNSKIAIVAGGTGGHVFPAISLLEELVNQKKEVLFFSDTRVQKIIQKNKFLFKKRKVFFNTLDISRNFFDFYNHIYNFFKILKILKKQKPEVVIGFGGYTSVLFLLASKLLLKKIILHEQNIIIGLANKLFLPFSKKIIYGWGDENINEKNKKTFFVRNPVRKKILNLRKKVSFKLEKKIINILIVGGSQGAVVFDEIIPKSIQLLSNNIKKKIFIYHQCSKLNIRKVKKVYKKNKIKCICAPFFVDLPELMFKSQFVISRSGSSTLSEISSLGKPAILIPYKFAKNNHQEKNAEWLVKKGGGKIILEKELTEKKLKECMELFIKNKKKLKEMAKKSFSIGDDKSLIKLVKILS